MCKFSMVSQVAAEKSDANMRRYELNCYTRRKEMARLAEEVNDFVDGRKTKRVRLKIANIPVKADFSHDGYISARKAAKALSLGDSVISNYCATGRIKGVKRKNATNSTSWFITKEVFNLIHQRIKRGLPISEVRVTKIKKEPSKPDLTGFTLLARACEEIGVSRAILSQHCRNGLIKAKKLHCGHRNQWAISDESMNQMRFNKAHGLPLNNNNEGDQNVKI